MKILNSEALNLLIGGAKSGNEKDLKSLIILMQDPIYGFALRMLWHPEEAQEATQEILIRIVTHLEQFRGESQFSTWVFAIASNHLKDCKKSRLEQVSLSYEEYSKDLHDGLQEPDESITSMPEFYKLLTEVRIGCTLGMLLCLDRNHRLSYILGEIFELDHNEASLALGISAATYRKQLSRARETVESFTRGNCGVVEAKNKCHCSKKVSTAISKGRISLTKLNHADNVDLLEFENIQNKVREVQNELKIVTLYKEHPRFKSPQNFGQIIGQIVKMKI